jgi:hypothetical protein
MDNLKEITKDQEMGIKRTISSRSRQFNQATYQLIDDYVRSVGGSTRVISNEGGWAWAELEYVLFGLPDLEAEFKVNKFIGHINGMYATLESLFSKMEAFGEGY